MSRNHSHDLLFKAKKKSPAFPWSGKNEEAPRSAWPKLIVDPGSLVPCAGVFVFFSGPKKTQKSEKSVQRGGEALKGLSNCCLNCGSTGII